jgi:hypothetical protein
MEMGQKEIGLIVKILLIVGVVFVGLSMLVPWLGVSGYLWGFTLLGQTSFFYVAFIQGETLAYGILLAVSTIVTLIFVIIALVTGIRAIINFGLNKPKTSLNAGILSLVSMIFFAIALNVGYSILGGIYAMSGISFGLGFFMMIIPIILFFTSYGLQITLLSSPTTPPVAKKPVYPQPVYQQPSTQQPISPPPPPMSTIIEQPQPTTPPPATSQQVQPQEEINFCAECGTKLESGASFCPECGTKRSLED